MATVDVHPVVIAVVYVYPFFGWVLAVQRKIGRRRVVEAISERFARACKWTGASAGLER